MKFHIEPSLQQSMLSWLHYASFLRLLILCLVGSRWVKLFTKLSQLLQDVESQYHRVSIIILKNIKLVTIAWNWCHPQKVMNVNHCFQCLFTVYHFGSFICITTSIKVRRKYCSQMDGRSYTNSLPHISHWGRLYHTYLNASEFQSNVIVFSFMVCSVILESKTLFQTCESLGLEQKVSFSPKISSFTNPMIIVIVCNCVISSVLILFHTVEVPFPSFRIL